MSVVSGVTLLCSCVEDDQMPALNAWLDSQQIIARFREVSESGGGNKAPQQDIYQAGYNYFREDEFAAFVGALPWQSPENVVLVIQPEDGKTRVWRFREGEWTPV